MTMASVKNHFKVTKSTTDSQGKKEINGKQGFSGSASSSLTQSQGLNEDKVVKTDHEILRQFDMEWKFGPCIGISRMERWERASDYGLNPPEDVKELIVKNSDKLEYTECVWNGYNI